MAKSKYETHVRPKLELIGFWARDGLTDADICKKLGISKQSLYTYKSKYAEFFDVLKNGKEVADYQVENALYKRAIGYSYQEVTEDVNEKGERVVKKIITKEVAPDTTAQIFWLKNRKAERWRDRPEPVSDDKSRLAELVRVIKEGAEK